MAAVCKEVETDLSPFIKVYRDGTVERIFSCPYVPPSPHDPITGVSSKDIAISSHVSARLYLPRKAMDLISTPQKIPILVYFHGGGFCLDSAFSAFHHRCINRLISKAAAVAVSVEYRLAPEHPLPAAYQDCWAALQWVASHADPQTHQILKEPWLISHGDFDRLYLGGDSAGGNIVHNIAMRAGAERLAGGVQIYGAFLSFPYLLDSRTHRAGDTSSKRRFLNTMWMLVHPSSPGGTDNPFINPFAEDAPDLSGIGCQKVLVCTSDKDELRESSLHYVEVLENSQWKGEVELVHIPGEDHCFHIYEADNEKAESLFNSLASFING